MYNVTPSAVGVIVYKVVGNRYIEKRVNVRVEHVRHSKCRQEFLDRVKANHDAHVIAKEKGGELIYNFGCLSVDDTASREIKPSPPTRSSTTSPHCHRW